MRDRTAMLRGEDEEIAAFARGELARYRERCGAAGMPPVTADSARARAAFPEAFAALRRDGFVIGRQGEEILIGGQNDRGLLYGVYEYVERALGIRFTEAPFYETDTGLRDPAWPREIIVQSPTFSYRGGCMHHSMTDWDFLYNVDRLGKARLNNVLLFPYQCELMKKHIAEYRRRGVRVTMGGHCWEDLFYDFGAVSREEAMAAHPSWHALVGGRRIPCGGEGMFCLSDSGAVDHFVSNALAWIEKYSDCIDVLSLWPNDTYALFCECEECRKHTPSDLVLRLVNRVAEEAARRYPYMQIEMLAYNDFTAPPRETIPAPNVLVNFAAIARDYRIPLYSEERRNIALLSDLRGWRALRPESDVIAYEYYRLDGIPKSNVIRYELERYRDEGLIGVMEDTFQDNPGGNFSRGTSVLGCMSWLEYKLMWNVDQSAETLLGTLLGELFGASAPAVWNVMRRGEQLQAARAYYNLLWHAWRGREIGTAEAEEYRLAFAERELSDMLSRIEEAEASAEGAVRERLGKLAATLRGQHGTALCLLCQMRAQLVFLRGGPTEEADAHLRRAMAAIGRTEVPLEGEELEAYIRAYDGLPASSVRMLKAVEHKDRAARVPIMENCEHICRRLRGEVGCLGCTSPVCPKAVRRVPHRDYV